MIDSLYVCQNGYVSLGNSTPDILTSPGDYNSALNATIMAPGLMKNNETSVELIGAYYGELDDPSDWDGEDDEDDGTNCFFTIEKFQLWVLLEVEREQPKENCALEAPIVCGRLQ